jgi:hypothetical protein
MTIPGSGQLDMAMINTEFGRGLNLAAYRGTTWWTDANQSGTFSAGQISMAEFYGKRATAPIIPGIKEFAFVNYAGSGATVQLGADSPKRYIVVTASIVGGGSNAPDFAGCTLDGVPLTLLVQRNSYNIGDGVASRCAIFGGYIPSGATAACAFTVVGGAALSGVARATYRLVGDSIQALATNTAPPTTMNLVNESGIIGVISSATGGTAITWSGLTRNYENDHGTWRSSAASTYTATAKAQGVDKSAGGCCLVSLYSP